MATKFSDLLSILQDEMHFSDEAAQRRSLVRALRHYRDTKFLCSERTVSMALRSGVSDYGVDEGLPGDLLAINHAEILQNGAAFHEVEPVEIGELRRLRSHPDLLGYPGVYCLYGQKLLLYPGPGSDMTLQIDMRSDCSRDEKTGAEIGATSSSDDFTNELVRRAEELLVARAAYSYFLGKGNGEKQAAQWKLAEREARQSMLGERDALKLTGAQAARYL